MRETKKEWEDYIKKRRALIRKLLLDENNKLVTKEEFRERLEKYGIKIEEENGRTNYRDETLEERARNSENNSATARTAQIPVMKAHRMLKNGRHPDELPPVEKRAERMANFDEAVSDEFERQLDEQDDPFPLEFHINN